MLLFLDDRGGPAVSEASPTVCIVTRNEADVTGGERAMPPVSRFFADLGAGLKSPGIDGRGDTIPGGWRRMLPT